jgi:hypothetical protein
MLEGALGGSHECNVLETRHGHIKRAAYPTYLFSVVYSIPPVRIFVVLLSRHQR